MFTNLIKSSSTLDRAIALSVAAMIAFNVVALTSQIPTPTALAQVSGNPAEQA